MSCFITSCRLPSSRGSAEGVMHLAVKRIQLAIDGVRCGRGLNTRGLARHRRHRRRESRMRPGRDRRRDGRAQRAGLGRARHFHGPPGYIGVNLHDERVLLRDAAAIDDLLDGTPYSSKRLIMVSAPKAVASISAR